MCVCVSVRASALQEAISGFKYAELLTRSCIYRLVTMDLAIGQAYSMLLSVCVHWCVRTCVFNELRVCPVCIWVVNGTHGVVLSKCHF